MDSLVIGKCVGFAEVAIYAVAGKIVLHYISQLIISGLRVLDPRFAMLDGAGEKTALRTLFMRSLFISSLLSFGLGMLTMTCGANFIIR